MQNQSPPAQASDEPMRAAFVSYMRNDLKCIVGSRDPYPAGIEREHWKTWQAAWRANRATPRATADVEQMEALLAAEKRKTLELQRVYDERGLQIERLETALYRAALKAQPAPAEAQGESPFKFRPWSKESEMMEGWTAAEKARNEAPANTSNNSSSSPQGSRLMELFTHALGSLALHDQAEAERIGKLYREAQSSGNAGELAQGEDSARLDAANARLLVAAKVYSHGYMQDEAEDEEDCVCGAAQHAEAKEVFAAIAEVERASAETGGVKP